MLVVNRLHLATAVVAPTANSPHADQLLRLQLHRTGGASFVRPQLPWPWTLLPLLLMLIVNLLHHEQRQQYRQTEVAELQPQLYLHHVVLFRSCRILAADIFTPAVCNPHLIRGGHGQTETTIIRAGNLILSF